MGDSGRIANANADDARPSQSQSRSESWWDAVVVGAGVAGSAVAFALGKQGRRVLVVERDLSMPERIVGELLQPGGVRKLNELGLSDAVEGIDAQEIYGYAMFRDGKTTCIKYPVEDLDEPIAGRSFHNGRFVQKLREAVRSVPSVTLREGTARRFLGPDASVPWKDGDPICGIVYKTGEHEREERASLTIVCDGMHSNLRPSLFPSEPKIEKPSFFVGILLRDCTLPFPNHGHVVLADPSPILFYPVSSEEVRCLIDIRAAKLPSVASGALRDHLENVIAPQVPMSLRAAFLASVRDGSTLKSMQNKSMPAEVYYNPGGLMLGDAFNMRHPLTGGGMTVALHDSKLLCDMLQTLDNFEDGFETAKATSAFHTQRKPWAATINTLANALYKVFCRTGEKWSDEMQSACFDYLSLGGIYSTGPISLLSGLNPRPFVLIAHFFMVAIYGIGRLLRPFPTPKSIALGVQLLMGACAIIVPIIRAEGIRAVFMPCLVRKPKQAKAQATAAKKTK
mmetsp:Transcript_7053/g.18003  ORF Transcript_7053/g.18003 Transcript_7053/m.18003 type:complete len:510 (+) Transcript_7053:131-1660(+)